VVGAEIEIDGVRSTDPLASQINYYDHFSVEWQTSTDDGQSWQTVGESWNRAYVTLGNPETTPYETLLAIGTEAGAGATTPQDAVTKIWQPFADLNVKTAAGKQMTYYKNWYVELSTDFHPDVKWLLTNLDGDCNNWAALWIYTLKAEGNQIQFDDTPIDRITPDSDYIKKYYNGGSNQISDYGFLIEWHFLKS
jgi:hypothetical protein